MEDEVKIATSGVACELVFVADKKAGTCGDTVAS